jgi:hypothetical protein
MPSPRNRGRWFACGVALILLVGVLIRLQTAAPENTPNPAQPPPLRKSSVSSHTREADPRDQPVPEVSLEMLPDLPAPILSSNPPDSTAHQEWVEKRTDELADLAWFDDQDSLAKILTELRNPLPEIRAAALGATRDFGSRDAIPYLEAISRDTQDPLEQKAIRDLIEHLKIPTFLDPSDSHEVE